MLILENVGTVTLDCCPILIAWGKKMQSAVDCKMQIGGRITKSQFSTSKIIINYSV